MSIEHFHSKRAREGGSRRIWMRLFFIDFQGQGKGGIIVERVDVGSSRGID